MAAALPLSLSIDHSGPRAHAFNHTVDRDPTAVLLVSLTPVEPGGREGGVPQYSSDTIYSVLVDRIEQEHPITPPLHCKRV